MPARKSAYGSTIRTEGTMGRFPRSYSFTSEPRRQTRQQVLDVGHIRRFGDVFVKTCFDRSSFVLRLTKSADGDEHYARAKRVAHARGDLIAVDAGKTDVDKGEVGLAVDDRGHAGDAVADCIDRVAEAAQLETQQLAHVGVVFDDDDATRLSVSGGDDRHAAFRFFRLFIRNRE